MATWIDQYDRSANHGGSQSDDTTNAIPLNLMIMQNQFVEYYKNKSYIFNRSQSSMTDNLQENDRQSILSNLLRIEGAKDQDHPDEFFDTGANSWRWCRIRQVEHELTELEQSFERFKTEKIRAGSKPVEKYPPELEEQRQKLLARLEVHRQEAEYLKKLLEKAPDQRKERERILHPSKWSTGQMQGGTLVSIAGIRVAPDSEGLLRISDQRSEFDGMPVWQFRAQICNPMFHEHRIREREAVEAVRKEGGKYVKPSWPRPGSWNPKTDLIEYENYHPAVIRKLKKTE